MMNPDDDSHSVARWAQLSIDLADAMVGPCPDHFLSLLEKHGVGRPGGMSADFGAKHGANTLLYRISSSNGPEAAPIAKALIDLGADIEFRSKDGRTPLISAAVSKAPEMTRLLLESGADVTAREVRMQGLEASVVGAFLLSGTSPVDLQILEDLIFFGASVKDTGTGRTALKLAIEHNSPERVRFLLAHGEDPMEPFSGVPLTSSSLSYARAGGYPDLVDIMQSWLDARAAGQAIEDIMTGGLLPKESTRPSP